MSAYSGPEIPNNGLIMMLDAANPKSYNTAENLITYSEQFDNNAWNKNSGITATPNSIASPTGTLTAETLTGNGVSIGYLVGTVNYTAGVAYTFSCYFKAGTQSSVLILLYGTSFNSGGSNITGTFNLSTGVVTSSTAASSSITDAGNGWYRCSITQTCTAGGSSGHQLIRLGSATGTIYAWGYQINTGPYIRPYVETTNSAVAASTTWTDLTGNGYNATLLNTYFVSTDGSAFETQGIAGSYIQQTTLNLTSTNYTVITATRYAAASPRGRMLNGRNNNWLLGNWSGTTENYFAAGWVSAIGAGTADTTWRIMAGTGQIAGDAYSVYVNGTNTVSNSTGGSAGPNGFLVGVQQNLSTELTLGRCSFILAYNRVLTATEVSQVFQAYRGRFGI